ncbi:hypothetical protein N0V83_003048 [Neocucurbitaria cava]|uniref:Uncharacterized protein n=1 Tax=Neocucurbitaria cava TaxID=798079 RepID=A0A9W8YG38_9PLEO|nr:hypothetical protein N0V83_003048 [Neocucurbitaria cava]
MIVLPSYLVGYKTSRSSHYPRSLLGKSTTMPKGKAKKDNPAMYQDSAVPQPRNMAPQAVAHRRGGTHRVRDSDRTDSIYDTYNYKELVDATKERGVYRKDMKKMEMAQALKNDDLEKRRVERYAVIEREKRHQEEKKAQQKRDAERLAAIEAERERKLQRKERRARQEVVSDDTLSETATEEEQRRADDMNEYAHEGIGQVISDESWDSTSSDSSAKSVNQPIIHDSRLRLFEWPYLHMPALSPSTLSPTLLEQEADTILHELVPWKIPYSPLKVVTTETKQKLFLPGQKYPPGVDLDYVPILSSQTRTAARNGVLESVLRKATIERATRWAERTQVQGWNARMYFELPSRIESKDLAEVYNRWSMENRRLLRVKGRGDGMPAVRERRRAQRHANKGRRMMEVYEASQYRPLAVCYIPSYLDFDSSHRGEEQEYVKEHRCVANLFFVRFPGCDLPHYYFWTRAGEWEDPTTINTEWNRTKTQEEPTAVLVESEFEDVQKAGRQSTQGQPCKTCGYPDSYRTQAKKSDTIQDESSLISEPTDLATTAARIERELFSDGLAATLQKYRLKWAEKGKSDAWESFAGVLPWLYPSGQMPAAPPVDAHGRHQMAMKLAMIDTVDEDERTPFSPLRGDEPWTRNDDKFFDTVEAVEGSVGKIVNEDIQEKLERCEDALYRRSSDAFGMNETDWTAWLDQVRPSHLPPSPISLVHSPAENVDFEERVEWRNSHMDAVGHSTSPACPFCSLAWEFMSDKVWHGTLTQGQYRLTVR